MKENKEFEKNDLEIDRDIQIDDDDPHRILAFVEVWCKVKEKFDVTLYENSVLDMYALYNPFDDTLELKCVVDHDDEDIENDRFDYEPTEGEAKLIKDMITEKIQAEHGQTPQEFCEEAIQENQNITFGGMQ